MKKIQQKGFSIYIVMIVLSMILAVSLNIASIIVTSAKMSGSFGDSIRAFHAADSGIEIALYRVTGTPASCGDFTGTFYNSDFAYSVTVPASPCDTGEVVSEGSYRTINKRTIKISY